jgi:hypothetical protein
MLSEASDLTSENIEKARRLLGPLGVLPFGDAEPRNPINVDLCRWVDCRIQCRRWYVSFYMHLLRIKLATESEALRLPMDLDRVI